MLAALTEASSLGYLHLCDCLCKLYENIVGNYQSTVMDDGDCRALLSITSTNDGNVHFLEKFIFSLEKLKLWDNILTSFQNRPPLRGRLLREPLLLADNGNPLFIAILQNDLGVCRIILEHGFSVDSLCMGWSALHIAAAFGSENLMVWLLDKQRGGTIDILSVDATTPLMVSIMQGRCEMVQLLLEKNANPNLVIGHDDQTRAPYLALFHNQFKIFDLLLRWPKTVFHISSVLPPNDRDKVYSVVEECGYNFEPLIRRGRHISTPTSLSIKGLTHVIDHDFAFNTYKIEQRHALSNTPEVYLRKLFESGFDLDCDFTFRNLSVFTSEDGDARRDFMRYLDDLRCFLKLNQLDLLFAHLARNNLPDSVLSTRMIFYNDDVSLKAENQLRVLINFGADVNVQSCVGKSILQVLLLTSGYNELQKSKLDFFLCYGLDVNHADHEGNSLLIDVCNKNNNNSENIGIIQQILNERNQFVALIIAAGGRVNQRNAHGQTAFHVFIEHTIRLQQKFQGQFEQKLLKVSQDLYRMFINAGGDVNSADNKGNTVTAMIDENNMNYFRTFQAF